VWVTTPRDKSIAILDAATAGALTWKTKIRLVGQPEGFAVDDARGVFFTNLEDKDRTLRIDVKSREITSTWLPGCGEDGPKGLAIDRGCSSSSPVRIASWYSTRDGMESGCPRSTLESTTSATSSHAASCAAAARAAKLTIARLDSHGVLTTLAVVPTVSGAQRRRHRGRHCLPDGSPEGILGLAPLAPQRPRLERQLIGRLAVTQADDVASG
jgi:hypothetical protein